MVDNHAVRRACDGVAVAGNTAGILRAVDRAAVGHRCGGRQRHRSLTYDTAGVISLIAAITHLTVVGSAVDGARRIADDTAHISAVRTLDCTLVRAALTVGDAADRRDRKARDTTDVGTCHTARRRAGTGTGDCARVGARTDRADHVTDDTTHRIAALDCAAVGDGAADRAARITGNAADASAAIDVRFVDAEGDVGGLIADDTADVHTADCAGSFTRRGYDDGTAAVVLDGAAVISAATALTGNTADIYRRACRRLFDFDDAPVLQIGTAAAADCIDSATHKTAHIRAAAARTGNGAVVVVQACGVVAKARRAVARDTADVTAACRDGAGVAVAALAVLTAPDGRLVSAARRSGRDITGNTADVTAGVDRHIVFEVVGIVLADDQNFARDTAGVIRAVNGLDGFCAVGSSITRFTIGESGSRCADRHRGLTNDTAGIVAFVAAVTDLRQVGGVFNRRSGIARNAADVRRRADDRTRRVVGGFCNGCGSVTNDTADILITSDAGVGYGNILDPCTRAYITEEALVVATIDTDAADGVALAVEGAAEVICTIFADGGVVVLGAGGVVPVGGVGVGDVGTEHEELAAEIVAAVHQGGQQVETCGGGDDIWSFIGAVGAAGDVPHIGPGSGIAAVAYGALGDGHRGGGLGEASACPASKGIACRGGGIGQGEGGSFDCVGGGVGGATAGEVVGDIIDDGSPGCGVGSVANGALGNGN